MNNEQVENRNLGCSCNNDTDYSNNNMSIMDISNMYMDNSNNCDDDKMTREEMMMKIKSYQFAVIELALYLDTHPEDEKALCLHRKYCKELKELKDKYQKVYGPLSINYPCNKWRWLEEPWPWERGNY